MREAGREVARERLAAAVEMGKRHQHELEELLGGAPAGTVYWSQPEDPAAWKPRPGGVVEPEPEQ